MGKLHDLVGFRNYLIDHLDYLSLDKSIQDKIESLEKTKRIFPEHANYCDQTIKNYFLIGQQSQAAINSIREQISRLDLEIDTTATSMFNDIKYHNTMSEDNIQGEQFANNLIISADLEAEIISKITEYSDWHYPALQISPRSKKWIDPMVAADPLYLTHCNIDLVKEIIKSYPDLYQNRLRLYEIIDRDFSKLPQAQFSFVLCWDYFNYLSSIFVEKYIKNVYHLLRPGGRFMFSYTNCDLAGSALRAESWACAYASSRWLKKLCDEIGYEICDLNDFDTGDAFNTNVSVAILKKPGNLATLKAAQAMAQIITK
jgi:SAM-dependent methyltransferase